MKRYLCVFVCLLAAAAIATGQNCSGLSNSHLAGTYAMYGSGYIDLSKLLPGVPGMPAGMIPMTWVGAHTYDGSGSGTGWVTLNAGGMRMDAQFASLSYSVQPDCSIQISFSMKIKQLGITIGPFPRLGVVARKGDTLEIHFILAPPPGEAGAGLDLGTAVRISMQY